MSEYKLNINLSDEALQVIENARNKINLVKRITQNVQKQHGILLGRLSKVM